MMNWKKSFQLGVLLLVAGAVVACSDDKKNNNNNPTEPQEPVPVITETFTGEIGQLETQCHFYTLTNVGDVTLQLTEIAPLSSITLGLALGTPASGRPERVRGLRSGQFSQACWRP